MCLELQAFAGFQGAVSARTIAFSLHKHVRKHRAQTPSHLRVTFEALVLGRIVIIVVQTGGPLTMTSISWHLPQTHVLLTLAVVESASQTGRDLQARLSIHANLVLLSCRLVNPVRLACLLVAPTESARVCPLTTAVSD